VSVTTNEVIQRLKLDPNRAAVARETGLREMYLYRLASGRIKDPGASKIERLRDYYVQREAPPH
jgi:hypothetical protein